MAWELKVLALILFIVIINAFENGSNARLSRPEMSDVAGSGNIDGEGDGESEGDDDSDEGDTLQTTTVNTTHGEVRGHVRTNNIPVMSFIDIPYGKYEKFQAPTVADPWADVHEVKEHKKICHQLNGNNLVGDADCLVLSIFKPIETKEPASVVFHIHDGHFIEGSGDYNIYGPEYLVGQGVIVVLPNYRLGVPGFVCLQNEIAPGNAALKDLTLALTWVKNNIAAFGGDPEKITVSAEGQAGALVGYLALSLKSKNLFNQVITESGAILAPWALDRNPRDKALKLIKSLSDESKDNKDSVLLEVELETILLEARKQNILFKPCIEAGDDAFIKETPWKIMNGKDFCTNITFMIGSANKAGIHETESHDNNSLAKLNDNYELLIPNDLVFPGNVAAKRNAANRIKKLYFDDKKISKETKEELALFYTDSCYLGPNLRLARPLLKAGAVVYLYEFACDGPRNLEKLALNSIIPGAARGDIIGYVFKQEEINSEEEEKEPIEEEESNNTNEELVVKLILDFWATFVKTGKPIAGSVLWERMNATNETLMIIGKEPALKESVHPERMNLWTELYNNHFVETSSSVLLSANIFSVAIFSFISFRAF